MKDLVESLWDSFATDLVCVLQIRRESIHDCRNYREKLGPHFGGYPVLIGVIMQWEMFLNLHCKLHVDSAQALTTNEKNVRVTKSGTLTKLWTSHLR